MASLLTKHLPHTRSGRTFFIALSLLGTGALLQFAVLGVYLGRGRLNPPRPSAVLPLPLHFSETLQPESSPGDASAALPSLLPVPAQISSANPADGAAATLAGPTIARPTPAASASYPAGSGDLIEQARQLRARGDTRSALARLREAQVAEPDNPQSIAEMALTYEAMQVPDRAFEQWQRLFGLGESVGALYYLADARLHAAPTAASTGVRPAQGADPIPRGNPPASGAVLTLVDIHREDLEDPAAEQKFALKIVVKGRPGTAIDPNKVIIRTYFYDLVDGKDLLLTDAQTGFAWLTPPPINWANDKSEVLETTYLRPKAVPAPVASATPAPAPGKNKARRGKSAVAEATPPPAATPAPVRTYAGYTVRLYYDGQLQDAQADPVRLMEKFPPPSTLTND